MGDLGIQASRPPVESYGDPGNRALAGNSAAECAEIDAEDGFPGWASEQDGGNAGSGTGVEDGFRKIGGSGGSFAARLAARTGGAGPRLNTARFKAMPPSSLPIPRSPCLTIPPGLSPTTLLDSPVLLSNSLVEPSPTTGTFSLPPFLFESISSCDSPSISSDASKNKGCEDGKSNFVFKPFAKSGNSSNLSPLGSSAAFGSTYEQAQPQSQPQSQSQCQSQSWTTTACAKEKQFLFDSPPERPVASTATDGPLNATTPLQAIPSHVTLTQSASLEEKQQRQNSIMQAQTSEVDPNVLVPLVVAEKPSEDGYNWRKYGQKLVKGSEYPRSYYKCTHPNCQMKKKLERSHDGQITEIIYKGVHDHPKPQPSRRSAVGAAHGGHDEEERNEGFGVIGKIEDPLSRAQGQTSNHIESTGTPEFSSSDDDGEGGGKLLVEDPDEDESDSKRRKTENGSVDIVTASRSIREPRVVVQTTSEIDILDDGYRWRKYGQKVVKGNPNPRSYYKCTNAGCPVRKHVERASHDPKAVITTYEGKHNHDVPAPRNSNHDNTGTGNAQSSAAMQSSFAVPSNSITRSVSQVQDSLPQFDRHPEQMYMFERVADGNLNSQDRHAGILDLRVGGSMGFGKPGFDNSLRQNEKLQPTRITPSISAQLHNSMNLGMAGAGFISRRPAGPFPSFFGQAKERSMDLLRPKQEMPENFSIEASAPPNHSSSSSIYHQSMGRLLLGP
uniref:WRKY domain-containing protein n=1 Tax=Araucaria cunninghamii TaxID=56994 RepID=A0A0D6QV38_ARACU